MLNQLKEINNRIDSINQHIIVVKHRLDKILKEVIKNETICKTK